MKKDKNVKLGSSHWEVNYDTKAATGDKMMDAFLPKKAKDRPRPHIKVNETDT